MKRIYVVGFAFSADKKQVVVISKTNPKNTLYEDRPVWLANKYNGIGTDLKEGELPDEGMVRTFNERAGVVTPQEIWKPFAEIQNPYATVIFYKAMLPKKQWEAITSKTNEQVMKCHMSQLHNYTMVSNLSWLLPMALDPLHNYSLTVDDKAEPVNNDTPLAMSRYGTPEPTINDMFKSRFPVRNVTIQKGASIGITGSDHYNGYPVVNVEEDWILYLTDCHIVMLDLIQECSEETKLTRGEVTFLMNACCKTISTSPFTYKESVDVCREQIKNYLAGVEPTIGELQQKIKDTPGGYMNVSGHVDKPLRSITDKLIYAVFDGNNAGESITITGNGLTATGDAKVAPAGAAEKIAGGGPKNSIDVTNGFKKADGIATGDFLENVYTRGGNDTKQGQDVIMGAGNEGLQD